MVNSLVTVAKFFYRLRDIFAVKLAIFALCIVTVDH